MNSLTPTQVRDCALIALGQTKALAGSKKHFVWELEILADGYGCVRLTCNYMNNNEYCKGYYGEITEVRWQRALRKVLQ